MNRPVRFGFMILATALAAGSVFADGKYPWRGFLLDESRHFFGKEVVTECLDAMKRAGLNVFHWHLTDDQGWRLDLAAFPELVRCGAVRPFSPPYGADRGSDGVPYGPFSYSEKEIAEVVAAAGDRGISVVPEIEMPGHVRALLAAHPEFACRPDGIAAGAWTEYGICKDVLCLGNDEAVEYCGRLLDEVVRIFPGEFVHLGGDECPDERWKSCPKCRARMAREGLKDGHALQGWFTRKMVERLRSHGRRAVVWDEALAGGLLPTDTVIQSWRGTEAGAAAASNGYDVVMSPWRETYFTIPEYKNDASGCKWREWVTEAGFSLPKARVRRFVPNAGVPEAFRPHILGGECCAWSELICSVDELRYKALSRLPAFGEAVNRDRETGEIRLFDETPEAKAKRLEWWTDARFGMFIHFGVYCMPARGEWIRTRERMTDEHYRDYFSRFDPDLLDARRWARQAKAAGMRYAVLTAKHHDGFCLFDSAYTDFKSTKTPFGRDIVREFVEAFRAEGLGVGLYYSLKDWNHPDFTIDNVHPRRPAGKGLQGVRNATDEELDKLNAGRDMERYRRYMKDQTRELLTNYGKIDIIWFDYSYPSETSRYGKGRDEWDSVGLIRLARSLQPDIIVDDRLDLRGTEDGWDFVSPESKKVPEWPTRNGKRVPWETCHAFASFFCYHRDEVGYKTPFQLLDLLVDSVSKGGNFLLNISPNGRGEIDGRAAERMSAIGRWMRRNSASVYGCTEAPEGLVAPANTVMTYNPKTGRLYIHLLVYPYKRLPVAFADRIEHAQLLHDASEVKVTNGELEIPVTKPDVEIPVIEVVLR